MDIKKNYENLIELQKILTKRFKLEEKVNKIININDEIKLDKGEFEKWED